jgi:hypothetical protein
MQENIWGVGITEPRCGANTIVYFLSVIFTPHIPSQEDQSHVTVMGTSGLLHP